MFWLKCRVEGMVGNSKGSGYWWERGNRFWRVPSNDEEDYSLLSDWVVETSNYIKCMLKLYRYITYFLKMLLRFSYF